MDPWKEVCWRAEGVSPPILAGISAHRGANALRSPAQGSKRVYLANVRGSDQMPSKAKKLSKPPAPRVEVPIGRCLLFAYGQLQPGLRPPRSLSRAWPDRVRGLLYDLGPYPAAVKIDAVDRWFQGFVLEIEQHELQEALDPYEEVDKRVYRRIRTVTGAGFEVWVYEYARPLPENAVGPIDRWPRAGATLRIKEGNE